MPFLATDNPMIRSENIRSLRRRGRSESDAVREALAASSQAKVGGDGTSPEGFEPMPGGVPMPPRGMRIPLPSGPRIGLPGTQGATGPMIPSPDGISGASVSGPLGSGADASPLPMPPSVTQGTPMARTGAPNVPFAPSGGGMEDMLLQRQLGRMQAR